MLREQEVNEIMSGCHPSYLRTVSQQVVCRIRTHSLRFLIPNTVILVGIIQIHTNFGCLKWLVKTVTHQKIFYLGGVENAFFMFSKWNLEASFILIFQIWIKDSNLSFITWKLYFNIIKITTSFKNLSIKKISSI